jgi:hypothetical protein
LLSSRRWNWLTFFPQEMAAFKLSSVLCARGGESGFAIRLLSAAAPACRGFICGEKCGNLLLHQFDASIQRPTFPGVIGRQGRIRAISVSLEPVGSHSILRGERLHHGRRAPFGELDIGGRRANIVRVSHDIDL